MPNRPFTVLRLFVVFLCTSACASADDAKISDDVSATGSSAQLRFRLELSVRHQDDAMCRALDAAIQKNWNPNEGRLCSIPIDEAGPQFSLPAWRNVSADDGVALLPEIREMAIIKGWRGPLKPYALQWEKRTGYKHRPVRAPEELVDQVWNPMEVDFVALLQSGELKVQEAEFDFNNNGEIDTIYRIRGWTLVETGRTDKPLEPEFWESETCPPGNIDTSFLYFKKRTHDYNYHDLADLLNSYAARSKIVGLYVFQYEEETFEHWFGLTGITKLPTNYDNAYCDWRRIKE